MNFGEIGPLDTAGNDKSKKDVLGCITRTWKKNWSNKNKFSKEKKTKSFHLYQKVKFILNIFQLLTRFFLLFLKNKV